MITHTWTLSLFAGLPERFGSSSLKLELPAGEMTAAELKAAVAQRFPAHAAILAAAFVACNQAYAADGDTVRSGDELALLPPVSGGEEQGEEQERSAEDDASRRFTLTREPLSADAISQLVIVPENGASLVFVGTTREWTKGKRTLKLEYEAYEPMAIRTLRQIGDEIAERWPGALCAISHRTGVVEIAEASVIIAVSAPHRGTCYEASRYAIERLKQIVPIWKKEIWEDGTEWVGHQQGPWNPVAPPTDEGGSVSS
ncbi:molybdenum cofactor biosynthesis protein [Paenibacillus beijingensis]|uniref:Molybdopterin synthase catalytic subunit n=1 Tax=Paenibacillus beijingensis TaxID=1126833 RepID=A0A0D5NM02_9BACL|nr:molybdenum cofactor biosynthesis protein MoaE [Paenibacillus beijingensis]AJY75963.1 molybdopterin converting factor [Paenibacillus beijingensis]